MNTIAICEECGAGNYTAVSVYAGLATRFECTRCDHVLAESDITEAYSVVSGLLVAA